MPMPMTPARRWLLLALTLAAVVLTARLGWWQLDRAAQKRALQAMVESRTGEPWLDGAAALAHDAAAADAQQQRRARVAGQWLAAQTIRLDNRQLDGRPGFYVLTPLRLDDGSALMVQRGWQPRDFIARDRLPALPTPAGRVVVEGRLTRGPARLYEFDAASRGPIRQNLDLSAYAREAGLALRPLLLLQTSAAEDGLRRDWPKPTVDVHKHYGYAFQWFALCALIIVLHVWYRVIRPRRTVRR